MRTGGVARASRRTAATPTVRLLFRAFSDPIRLRILCLVRKRDICVGDLVKVLRVPQATASRHLTYLRRAKLVAARKDGLWVHYSLRPSASSLHRHLLACLEDCAEVLPEVVVDERRHAAIRRSGGCCPS